MNKKISLLFLFLTLLSFKDSKATHIVGGEIYYDYMGSNNYKITLKAYRDCYNGVPPLDDPAYVYVFDANGTLRDSLLLASPVSTVLPPVISNPCFTPPTDVCVEEGIYIGMIHLPPIPGGYDLSYQRCCRNNSILNLINPGDVGSTYMAHIPSSTITTVNSSPRFNSFPPIFICSGVPFIYDHSATDPDGDSLYYEFCDPYHGASPTCPQFGAPAGFGCPNSGTPPPYPYVPWQTPYSATYPMSSSPAMNVNQNSGLMTGTPNMIGQWVVGVCVSEYRHGVFLDMNKRDFQFNVVPCPGLPVASIPQQTTFCMGMTVNFTQNSAGANTYLWNFGDPTTTSDVSSAFAPSWTYSLPGTYTVTLIINAGTLCADTNSVSYDVHPLLAPNFVTPPAECFDNNSFNFTAGGVFQGTGTFHWNFGTGATPASSSVQNPSNVVFNSAGMHPVSLTITENGCSNTYTAPVQVYPKPSANFGLTSTVSCILNPVHFIDSSIADTPLTYQWNFDNDSTSTLQNPVTTYLAVGTYNVNLIVTTQHGCKDTVELPAPLNVLPPPVASFSYATHCFSNLITFTQGSTGGAFYHWDFGDPATTLDVSSASSPAYTYPAAGNYNVIMNVNPGTSCTAVDTLPLHINPPLIPDLSPQEECISNNSFSFSPGGSYMGNGTFSWTFGTHCIPLSSSLENPSGIVYDTTGAFPIHLTITENGCTAHDSTMVHVYPKPDAFFEATTPTGCALNPVHFIQSSTSDSPLTFLWNFGNGLSSTAANPYVTYADSGSYTISLEITTSHGCKDTFIYPAPLVVFPSPVAAFNVNPDYTSIFAPDVVMTDHSSGAISCEANWGDGFITNDCGATHAYTESGTFVLSQIVVNEYGCADTAYSQVIIDPNYLFWLPNAFTPGNMDGLNDTFKPKVIGIHDYLFMIFDRWGEKIFETQNTEEGWNGWYKGNLCSNDVYVYKIIFRDDRRNDHHELIGRVTLVR